MLRDDIKDNNIKIRIGTNTRLKTSQVVSLKDFTRTFWILQKMLRDFENVLDTATDA